MTEISSVRHPRPLGRRYLRWVPWTATAVAFVAFWILSPVPATSDAHSYAALNLSDPYRGRFLDAQAFVYSPAFGQLIYPFTLLPDVAFYKLAQAVNLVCLAWLLGPWSLVALLLPPVQTELGTNNIHFPLAVMTVLAFRHPAVWAFGLLTKVTPGIGLLWHIARGEWRPVWVCLLVTAGIAVVSALFLPDAWLDWFGLLGESGLKTEGRFAVNEWPALFRLPVAGGLMIVAAWRDRPAAVPAIICLALPAIWFGSLVMLVAIPRLARLSGDRPHGSAQLHKPAPPEHK